MISFTSSIQSILLQFHIIISKWKGNQCSFAHKGCECKKKQNYRPPTIETQDENDNFQSQDNILGSHDKATNIHGARIASFMDLFEKSMEFLPNNNQPPDVINLIDIALTPIIGNTKVKKEKQQWFFSSHWIHKQKQQNITEGNGQNQHHATWNWRRLFKIATLGNNWVISNQEITRYIRWKNEWSMYCQI